MILNKEPDHVILSIWRSISISIEGEVETEMFGNEVTQV